MQPQSETVWRQADRYGVPRLAFINKMDRTGADFERCVEMMRTRLGARPVLMQLPIGAEEDFTGVVDLVGQKALYFDEASKGMQMVEEDIPSNMAEAVEYARQELVETACEFNDEMMECYLEGEEPSPAELKTALRNGVLQGEIIPVFLGSAFKNKGIQPLLDAVVELLPSPLEVRTITGENEQGELEERPADDDAPLAALAFKLMADPYVGHLTFLRIYSGCLKSGDSVLNVSTGKKERIGRLLKMHANNREEIKEVYAGDIVAAVGLKNTSTGDSLCAPDSPVTLESLHIPEPVVAVAIQPDSKPMVEKLGLALQRIAAEDPSFRIKHDQETNQTIISGMGELHLEIIVDRLLREFKVAATVGAPQVAYREKLLKAGKANTRFAKQTGGRGQFAHVVIDIQPGEPGSGFVFNNQIVGGSIPKEYIKPVEAGIKNAAEKGVLAGFPLEDFEVSLVDGSHHEVDSSERAFFVAGSMAFKEAAKSAGLGLIEPIMKLEVTTPDDYLGDVMGDISSRRGKVQSMDSRPGVQVVTANVPLASMFGYAGDLRSATQGRATFSMEFSHYEPVPEALAEDVIKRAKADREASQRGLAA